MPATRACALMPANFSNSFRSNGLLLRQIGDRREARGKAGIVREIADQPVAQRKPVLGRARGQHLDLHLGHVDAGRAFVAAGLAGHAEFQRIHHLVGGQRVRSELARYRQPQCVGAAPRHILFVAGGAIGRTHHAALELPAGAVVVAHLDRALKTAAGGLVEQSRCATTTVRKLEGGVMCPSLLGDPQRKGCYAGPRQHAAAAISGQLGPDALASDEMMDTLKLCVSCKACRHACPTGVDMAKMKIEVLAARAAKHGLSLRDRLVGYLSRYAGFASRFAPLANWRNTSPLLRKLLDPFPA